VRIAAIVLALALASCASPQVIAQRDALALFNRCVSALQEKNSELYRACLSHRLRGEEEARAAKTDPDEHAAALRDTHPYATVVEKVELAPDLKSATLTTLNYSSILEQRVEHRETVVLVVEDGRWVIDKDCCDYSASRLLDEPTSPEPVPDSPGIVATPETPGEVSPSEH
jgi:hypothetical protein